MKKLLSMLMIIATIFFTTGGVFAETTSTVTKQSDSNFMDIASYNAVYKMSEDADVKLPFIKAFAENATYDKLIGSSGLTLAATRMDISSEMKGVQTIFGGDTVNITGKLEYANIIANNVIIDGEISKDVLIISQSVFVTEKAKIGGDLVCMAGEVDLKGKVEGNVILGSETAKVSALIGKDFRASATNLEISATTEMKGNIYIETDSALNILDKYPNAVVTKIPVDTESNVNTQTVKDMAIAGIIAVLSYVLLYYIVKKLNKNVMSKYSAKVKSYPTFTILMGFASLFLIPLEMLVILILCAAGLGVVLGPILVIYIALFIGALLLSTFMAGSIIFEILAPMLIKNREENKNAKWLEALLILCIFAVLYTLTKLPVIGGYAVAFVVILSIGSIVTNMFRKEKVVVEIKENK